jgi:hypothetical protein
MDRRRFLLTSLAGAIAGPLAVEGQQTTITKVAISAPDRPVRQKM